MKTGFAPWYFLFHGKPPICLCQPLSHSRYHFQWHFDRNLWRLHNLNGSRQVKMKITLKRHQDRESGTIWAQFRPVQHSPILRSGHMRPASLIACFAGLFAFNPPSIKLTVPSSHFTGSKYIGAAHVASPASHKYICDG